MVRSGQVTGRSGRVIGLGALSTVNNMEVLRNFMLRHRPSRTLEVGLCFAGSALTIAASHRDLGHSPQHQHTTIDPYQPSLADNAGLDAIERAGLSGFIDFQPLPSSIALASLLAAGHNFGLIYVDGSHKFEDVFVDAYFSSRLLAVGGVMMFDDSTDPQVAKALSYLCAHYRGWIDEFDLSSYRADGGSLRYRVGRQLGKVQLRAFRCLGEDTRPSKPLRRF